MIYDSIGFIEANASLFHQRDLPAVLQIEPSRPLFMLTIYINYLLFGMSTYYYRLISALLLAIAGSGLFVFLYPGTWHPEWLGGDKFQD